MADFIVDFLCGFLLGYMYWQVYKHYFVKPKQKVEECKLHRWEIDPNSNKTTCVHCGMIAGGDYKYGQSRRT